MGAGKSSVVDGICYALFGTFPALNSKRVTLSETIRKHPNPAESAKVTLFFDVNGESYSLERLVLNEKSNQATLRCNGKVLAGPSPREVNDRVETLLGMDFELFSRAVYAEQNHTDYFLRLSPGQRKEKLDELLGLARYEQVRSRSLQLQNRFKRVLEAQQKTLQSLQGSFSAADWNQLAEQVANGEKELIETERVALEKKKSEEHARLRVNQMRDLQQSFRKMHEDWVKETALMNQCQGELEELKRKLPMAWPTKAEIESQEARLKEESKAVIMLGQTRQRLGGQLSAAKDSWQKTKLELDKMPAGSVVELSMELKRQLERAGELEQLVEKRVVEAKGILATISPKEASYNLLVKQKNQLLSLGQDNCPICLQKLDEAHRDHVITDLQVQITPLMAELEQLRESLHLCENQHIVVKKELDDCKQTVEKTRTALMGAEKRKMLEDQLRDFEQSVNALQKEMDSLPSFTEKDLLKVESELQQCTLFLQGFSLMEKLSLLEKNVVRKEQSLKEIGFSEEALRMAEGELDGAFKQKLESEHAFSNLKLKVGAAQKEFARLGLVQAEITKLSEQCNRFETAVTNLGIFGQTLMDVQGKLRVELVGTINESISQVWGRIYPYRDLISCQIGVDESGGYEIEVIRQSGEKSRVEGILSGGERMSAALALRMSFALVLTQNLSWLILDEPTHNLDQKGVKELGNTLRGTLPSLVDQVFIITHDPLLEVAATASVYEIGRDKDVQGVSVPVRKEFLRIED